MQASKSKRSLATEGTPCTSLKTLNLKIAMLTITTSQTEMYAMMLATQNFSYNSATSSFSQHSFVKVMPSTKEDAFEVFENNYSNPPKVHKALHPVIPIPLDRETKKPAEIIKDPFAEFF